MEKVIKSASRIISRLIVPSEEAMQSHGLDNGKKKNSGLRTWMSKAIGNKSEAPMRGSAARCSCGNHTLPVYLRSLVWHVCTTFEMT